MTSPSDPGALLERHQVAVYLGALTAGGIVGLATPTLGQRLEHAITPILAALLYVTFLQVPVRNLARSARAGRFLAAVLVVNFVVAPAAVAAMVPFLPADPAVRLGVLLVLLTPCVDYVIVFTGLAGGSSRLLLSATPLLLIAQMALLPVFLLVLLGSDVADVVEIGPFVEAFVLLIVIPLILAWLTQTWAARTASGNRFVAASAAMMVPLMAATLVVVVASQLPRLDEGLSQVAEVVPFYVAFLAVMPFAGLLVTRLFRLDIHAARAVVFSGATRNSLVVLPLTLALPDSLAIATVVVLTQTLVELIGLVVYVKVVPRLLPA